MEQDLYSNALLFQVNNTRQRRSTTISQERRQKSQKKEEVIKKKKKKTLSGISTGAWNLRQTKLFIKFLRDHRNSFYGLKSRRKQKIFIKMSDFIGSRTPDQCRSHHQKVMFHFKQLDDMIVHYQVQFLSKNQKNNQVFHAKKQSKEVPTTQSQNKGPYCIKYQGNSLIITIPQSSIKIIQ